MATKTTHRKTKQKLGATTSQIIQTKRKAVEACSTVLISDKP